METTQATNLLPVPHKGRRRRILWGFIGLTFFASVLALILLTRHGATAQQRQGIPLLLLSMDGCRFDYLSNESALADPRLPFRALPNLRKLMATGAHVRDGLIPNFPTKTFPNHWSLVTGMFEESHGIVGNNMYDPIFDATFTMSNTEARWWDERDPIWLYAERQARKSASYFWPGSAVEGRGPQTFVVPYNPNIPFDVRVDAVVEWLKTYDFVSVYFEEPDTSGHASGPYGAATSNALEKLDAVIGRLMSKLEGPVNLVVTADHGMAEVAPSRVVVLETLIDLSSVRLTDVTPVTGIWPLGTTNVTDLFAQLNSSEAAQKGLIAVYLREQIPPQYHYRNNRRIPPLIVVAAEGYSIVPRQSQAPSVCCGDHGYNNSLPSMRPPFVANGPAFRKGFTLNTTVPNVDVFPLLCHLLGIAIPSDVNGSLAGLSPLLTTPPTW